MKKSKSRRIPDDDEVEDSTTFKVNECSTLDHIYPGNPPGPDTKCFCGKRTFKPFIKLDDYLTAGMFIQTYPGGPVYEVEMVNKSRARCRVITTSDLRRRKEDAKPIFMPMPGSYVVGAEAEAVEKLNNEEDERRGRVINISPRSVVFRVSAADLESGTHSQGSDSMAKSNVAALPIAGKVNKAAKLAVKPNGAAKPLSGAAAKAKAAARPKTPKTVRKCGCGCGGETMANFVPGHDARYKGWMKKLASGELDQAGLRKLMGKQFDKYTFKKVGAGFAPRESYQEVAG